MSTAATPASVPGTNPISAKPILLIEEYASSRLMFVWPIAATPPRMVEASAEKIVICRHASVAGPSASTATRTSSAIAATLEDDARKAVTGVGAPSYTSGVHMWNGTAAI